MITSYSELQTSIANWVHDDVLTPIIPDFIMLAEKRIERDVRCRENEADLSVTISTGTAAVPSDYVELKYAYLDLSPVRVLERTTARKVFEQYPNRSSSGIPKLIASDKNQFIFGCYPAGDYTVKGTYYAKLTGVATSWNALATAYPDLYLCASMVEAMTYILDEARIGVWEAKYQNILKDLNEQEQSEKGSGSPLRVKAG